MNRNHVRLALCFVVWSAVNCFGQQDVTVSDNLEGLFDALEGGSYQHALICNPFTTRFDVLTAAAQKGTRVDVIMQENYLDDYYKEEVLRSDKKKVVVGYSANVHDKIALLIAVQRHSPMVGYLGSANFSDNHFGNTELVMRIADAGKIPGFTKHFASLFPRADICQGVKPGHSLPQLPKGPPSSRRDRRGSCTQVELISCFDFEQADVQDDESDDLEPDNNDFYGLVSWVADRIKVDGKHNYLISTMTLDHPEVIERIRQAVSQGSTCKVIVDKDSLFKSEQDKSSLFALIRSCQCYQNGLVVRVGDGAEPSESSIHHAKLLVRYPNKETRKDGVSIVSTANFTKGGEEQSNCVLVLPHDGTDRSTVRALDQKFYAWWRKASDIFSHFSRKKYVDEYESEQSENDDEGDDSESDEDDESSGDEADYFEDVDDEDYDSEGDVSSEFKYNDWDGDDFEVEHRHWRNRGQQRRSYSRPEWRDRGYYYKSGRRRYNNWDRW